MALFAALEAGGTKFICAVGVMTSAAGADGPVQILARARFDTEHPEQTLPACAAFFKKAQADFGPIERLGIASFGPLELDRKSEAYGSITQATKPGWPGTNLARFFERELAVPVVLDTDVNGAVLAEVLWGAAKGLDHAVYITVGTGIGAGAWSQGAVLHGLMHPEMGHVSLTRLQDDKGFNSVCPFHADCAEGLASGPAITKRWGMPAHDLPDDHPAWDMEARYLAQLCSTLTLVLSPQRIILGGGVMERPVMIEKVRAAFESDFSGYINTIERAGGIKSYLVRESHGGQSGLIGAFALASETMKF